MEPRIVAIDVVLGRQHRQRRIGEQRVAGADRVDHASTKLSTTKKLSSDSCSLVAAGQHAALAELEDQQSCSRACVVERRGQRPHAGILVAEREARLALVRRDQVEALEFE